MEVAYNNSFIFHGPHVHNFTEMYNFLGIENIAFEIKYEKELIEQLEKKIETPQNININEKIVKVGNEILLSTIKKLDQYIVN
jgi:3-deoxy-D-manno-octulosonic-acid transferase